jgi:hypothetical protein
VVSKVHLGGLLLLFGRAGPGRVSDLPERISTSSSCPY